MSSNATAAFGTLLELGDGALNFTTIAEVKTIGGPDLTVDVEDVTHHTSPGAYEEVVATIIRTGEVTFGVNWIPGNATQSYSAGALKDLTDKTLRNIQIAWADAASTVWLLPGYFVGFSPTADHDGPLDGEFTFKISGQPTLA